MHKLNKGPGMKVKLPERPAHKVVPFTPRRAASAHGLAADVEHVGEEVKADVERLFKTKTKPFDGIVEDPDVEQVIGADEFKNWGKNVSFRASYTLVVHTVAGVCRVVKWAAENDKKVRVAGFRHSWRYVMPCS